MWFWWVTSAWAGPADDGSGLPLAIAHTPEERLYGRMDDHGGPVEGRLRRRRDAEFVAWELPSGTVVRYQHLAGSRIQDEHLFDAGGYPLVSVIYANGIPEKATVHAVPSAEIPLVGWAKRQVPGGTLLLPALPDDRPGGGARVDALGGEVDVWVETRTDPFSDTFRDGLLAGCGCFVVDRATTWIDGRVGVRYRLLIPGRWPRDAVDVWAVEIPSGLWLMSYRVSGPEDPVAALMPGRVLTALVALEGDP